MMARIGLMKALNRHVVREFTDRKEHPELEYRLVFWFDNWCALTLTAPPPHGRKN